MTTHLPIYRLPHAANIDLPSYATAGAAGMDVRAAVPDDHPIVIEPGGRALVPTGFALAIPSGFEIQIRPRSGLALKHGVTCLNSPGTIDCDYRGEVKILLVNLGDVPFAVERGMRVAQMVLAPVVRAALHETDQLLEATARGAGGFGSTGTS